MGVSTTSRNQATTERPLVSFHHLKPELSASEVELAQEDVAGGVHTINIEKEEIVIRQSGMYFVIRQSTNATKNCRVKVTPTMTEMSMSLPFLLIVLDAIL